MIKFLGILSFAVISATSCNTSEKTSLDSPEADSLAKQSESAIYAQADSTFNVAGKIFAVTVTQLDLTEMTVAKGDTLSRPTYACMVAIADSNKKNVFADSVLRDSWGYGGKIAPIDAYQISLPMLSSQANEIILSFNVYEEVDGDAITGHIAFDVNTLQSRYYWEEAIWGE
jgi:hypothetical protein